jgi:predicted nucleic acid-binding protein
VTSIVVFLDANTVIYLIEQPPTLGSKATARVTALLAGGERLAVSDLVRMECQVGPLKANDVALRARYVTFCPSRYPQTRPQSRSEDHPFPSL